jgi:hypothetical protein
LSGVSGVSDGSARPVSGAPDASKSSGPSS